MVGGRNEKAGGMTLLLLSSFVPPLDSTHLIILYNLLHGWGLEFLVLDFDGTTSLLLSPRFITIDHLVQCTLFGIVSILGENANFSISYLDECIPIGVRFL